MKARLLFHRLIACVLTAAAVCSRPAVAAVDSTWTGGGTRLCPTGGAQSQSTAIPDGAGGMCVGWWENRSGTFDVYLQRITATGEAALGWPSTGLLIRPDANAFAYEPVQVVADGAGGVYVAWFDYRSYSVTGHQSVYLQHVDAAGVIQWTPGGVPVTNTAYSCFSATSDGIGGVLVAWEDDRTSGGFVHAYAQRFNAAGVALWNSGGCSTNTSTTAEQYCPMVLSDGSGGAIIGWEDHRLAGAPSAYAQRFSATGSLQWPDTALGLATSSLHAPGVRLVSDGAGGLIVAVPGRMSRWSSAGGLIWSTVTPTNGGRTLEMVSLLADGAGGAFAAWDSLTRPPTVTRAIYAEHFNAAGSAQWGWPAVCSGAVGSGVSMLSDGLGGAFLAWADGRQNGATYPNSLLNIYAQRVTSSGARASGWPDSGLAVCLADSEQWSPQLVADGANGAMLIWTDYRTANSALHAAKLQGDGVVPTLLSLVEAAWHMGQIHVRWYVHAGPATAIELERREEGGTWQLLGPLMADGTGYLEYVDRAAVTSRSYDYRLKVDGNDLGSEAHVAPTAWSTLHLGSPRPNPASGAWEVTYELSGEAVARLEVFDLAGRLVFRTNLASRAGRLNGPMLSPGVYSVRLKQGSRVANKALVVSP